MASGNYPIEIYEKEEFEALQKTVVLIQGVLESIPCDYSQPENAASDSAIEFISEAIYD